MQRILLGQVLRLELSVTNSEGTPVIPGDVFLQIKYPTGTVETLGIGEISPISTGKYYANITVEHLGTYHIKWKTAVSNVGIVEDSFYVNSPIIP